MFVLTDPKLPVTLWLNGGPGCSSMQGLFNENGPVNFIHRTATLKENQYSWTKLVPNPTLS
jgi:carboxypeptidase C (cathepsin A)